MVGSASRRTRGADDIHTGGLTAHRLIDVKKRHVLQFVGCYGTDGCGDIAAILYTVTHNHNLIDTDCIGKHLHINNSLATDGNLLWVHTQKIKHQHVAARGCDLIVAVDVGNGVGVFSFDNNGCTYERFLGIIDNGA